MAKLNKNMRFDLLSTHGPDGREDTGETVFFARQLEQIRSKAYDTKLVHLRLRELVPVDHSVSPGAEIVTYRQFTPVGMAKIIRDYANDLPRADVTGAEFTSVIRSIGSSYGYSVQEIRAAQMAGVDLDQKKANAARRMIEEQIDTVGSLGSAAHNIIGLLNQSNTTTFTVPTGVGGYTWALKTADEILLDLHGIFNGIVSATKEIEKPTDLVLPTAQYNLIATRFRSTLSDKTILQAFLEASPYCKRVSSWTRLATAGDGGVARMLCYTPDPDILVLVIPQEFEQFPPQARNLSYVTPCHARIGGVQCFYPLAMSYGDGI